MGGRQSVRCDRSDQRRSERQMAQIRRQQKATQGNKRQQKANDIDQKAAEGNKRQQEATRGNRKQQKAAEGNRRQQKATEGNKRQQKATEGNRRQTSAGARLISSSSSHQPSRTAFTRAPSTKAKAKSFSAIMLAFSAADTSLPNLCQASLHTAAYTFTLSTSH